MYLVLFYFSVFVRAFIIKFVHDLMTYLHVNSVRKNHIGSLYASWIVNW